MTTAMTELPKSYSPHECEGEVRERWEATAAFHVEPPTAGGSPSTYCILIPPPNVTAALHLGHALNNTLQDVLIRFHRMRGDLTLWMPGTDHAGIATQTVVERRLLQQEDKRRADFTRESFIERVQSWKDEYEATITEQLRSLGCSCDWERRRFTMDPVCVRAVREAFFRLFRDGLIYRGKRLVNWDPVTLTALADDEVEMEEVQGHMWYLRYPLEGSPDEHVVVATTRPETMLGDTAVAVNPKDPRAQKLVGRSVRLPIVDRVIPIVADDYVVLPTSMGGDPGDPKAEYATGFLKVTPAHDPNDWDIGLRHGLPVVNVLAPDATISRDHGWPADEFQSGQAAAAEPLLGLTREDARAKVVAWFKAHDLLDAVRDYSHSVGHSYRSHVPIEPYLSDQWYVRVTDDRMAGEALRALDPEQHEGTPPRRADGSTHDHDGGLRFFPPRYARMYQAWHENIRDWCISRQIWWGHRVPVWSADAGDGMAAAWRDLADRHPDRLALHETDRGLHLCFLDDADELVARAEADGFVRDPDVLDTWFSSALWPISTMGWPEPADFPETIGLLEAFNPSSVLVTGRDFITLWVSRMVMFNRYLRDHVLPFEHVYINPMIQDGHGQRMSKSLGNGVDPRDIIHSHGADALRFVLVQMATATQDVRLPVDMVCPHCQHAFHPGEVTSAAGHRVAPPRPICPECGKTMVSAYGAASGVASPTDEMPLARNTSSKFDLGRNFCNKIWNATRLSLGILGDGDGAASPPGSLPLVDRWMLTRLHRALHVVEDALDDYQLSVYADAMYTLFWRDFCDWYLEAIKPTVRDDPAQQQVLRTVLHALFRMLHPACPFITEALWPSVRAAGEPGLDGIELPVDELLARTPWPDVACRVDDADAADTFERVQTLTNAIRQLRSQHDVPPRRKVRLWAPPAVVDLIGRAGGVVETLAELAGVETWDGTHREPGAVPLTFEGHELLLSDMKDAVDIDAERARLEKLASEKQTAIDGYARKLANSGYVSNAPERIVDETRSRLAQAEADLAAARQALESLSRAADPGSG